MNAESFIRKRASIKARLTHFETYLSSFTTDDENISSVQAVELEQRVIRTSGNVGARSTSPNFNKRQRWKSSSGQLRVDDLVLIKDNNVPPFKWRLGRVTVVYPGSDGVDRVAAIRTADGVRFDVLSKMSFEGLNCYCLPLCDVYIGAGFR
ncbi:hypothetical protein NQ318_010290 [Aromia moschata]|uniref:DUF5641 domain-containing protein n=1 Tax=Aromia moschata TaxID=1265417 RepID=A0AAV8X559_9CUCU|nr:hypothetical protein NQ318_010290 [Aromia moschata]